MLGFCKTGCVIGQLVHDGNGKTDQRRSMASARKLES